MSSLHRSLPLAGLALALAACEGSPVAPAATTAPLFSVNPGVPTARAELHPVNRSGAHATLTFEDDGVTLRIRGTAEGLDPAGAYRSLIYDVGSVSGGPEACEPTIFDPTDPGFLLPTMLIGFWVVDANGHGTLQADNILLGNVPSGIRVHVPLGKFKTASIRDGRINNGFGAEAVAACGEVAVHPQG